MKKALQVIQMMNQKIQQVNLALMEAEDLALMEAMGLARMEAVQLREEGATVPEVVVAQMEVQPVVVAVVHLQNQKILVLMVVQTQAKAQILAKEETTQLSRDLLIKAHQVVIVEIQHQAVAHQRQAVLVSQKKSRRKNKTHCFK